ncbi:MAG TPA: endonuclease/exonuclease/phosphatase family protein [Usitatibacter sp.]|nr:endonuclease/exonuclease/phosphatase family protein [Usitatibacter sp.]
MRYLDRFFIAATFAVCAGTSLLMFAGPEHVAVLADLQYVPWYAFLVPALASMLPALRLGSRWLAMSAASVLLVPLVLMDLTLASGERGEHTVRVMTFNVKDYETLRSADGAARLVAEVLRYDPDILVLQDSEDFYDRIHDDKLFPGRYLFTADEYAIVSRHPLQDCRHRRVPVPGKSLYHIVCRVKSPDWQLDVHVVHLVSPRLGLTAWRYGPIRGVHDWDSNVEARMAQTRVLADFVASSPRPAIVAGDLNAPPHSLILRILREAGFRDAYAAAGHGFGFTYGHELPGGLSFLRLDHVLVDDSIGVADCFVGPPGVSPHRPVIADLVLRPDRK